tara:strand:+ start:336 stop:1613 length:1278 start_codon:yes stop_codon:yes gene_type:complete
MQNFIFISILSFFLQNIIGYLKFRKLINPIFLFTIIHFFHNWSFSLTRYFDEFLIWRSDPSVSYDSINDVLYMNLIGGWSFFVIIIFFANTKKFHKYYKIDKSKFFLNAYYFLSFIFGLRFISQISGGFIYGENQALDSISAFDPISRILFLRIIFCVFHIILFSNKNNPQLLKILIFESVLSFLMGERKDFILIFLSTIITLFKNVKLNILSFLKYSTGISVISFIMIFIPIYRSIVYTNNIYNQISETIFILKEYGMQIIFYGLNLANSEGVQNWTYQLIENGEMKLLYGKSYLQALINTVLLRPFQGETIANWQGSYHFKNIAYPNVTNQGWDFTFTAEAIQNFGGNFYFISFVLLGFLISFFYQNRHYSDLYKILYYFSWPILAISFRTDSTSMFRIFSYIIFLYIFLYYSNRIQLIKDRG